MGRVFTGLGLFDAGSGVEVVLAGHLFWWFWGLRAFWFADGFDLLRTLFWCGVGII